MFLAILFWVLVVISLAFGWAAGQGRPWGQYYGIPIVLLIVILGLRVFPIPVH